LALRLARVFEVPVEALFSLDPFPSLASQLATVAAPAPAVGPHSVPGLLGHLLNPAPAS
jgi:hypothetical protein